MLGDERCHVRFHFGKDVLRNLVANTARDSYWCVGGTRLRGHDVAHDSKILATDEVSSASIFFTTSE